jgi:hypothetical protein
VSAKAADGSHGLQSALIILCLARDMDMDV